MVKVLADEQARLRVRLDPLNGAYRIRRAAFPTDLLVALHVLELD